MNDTVNRASVTLGYLKLTDAAPFIVAQELGYFAAVNVDVKLEQDVSWANIRDKLATGVLDGAHMLAPLPAMTTLGVSGIRVPLISGLVLSRNGNAITLSKRLLEGLSLQQFAASERLVSASLLRYLSEKKNMKLTLAVVHGFSTHNLMLRRWLRQSDIDPDRDVSIIVVPPSQVVDSLKTGLIDGFCAGAPWGSIAVAEGAGITAAAGIDVWHNAPEKVFCVTQAWHEQHQDKHLRLRYALMCACDWLTDMNNRRACAEILSLPCYLDLPVEQLLPSLSGEMPVGASQTPQFVADFHCFAPSAPDSEQFEDMINECLSMIAIDVDPARLAALTEQTARSDLFEESRNWHPPSSVG